MVVFVPNVWYDNIRELVSTSIRPWTVQQIVEGIEDHYYILQLPEKIDPENRFITRHTYSLTHLTFLRIILLMALRLDYVVRNLLMYCGIFRLRIFAVWFLWHTGIK